jgi:hypothetical protein
MDSSIFSGKMPALSRAARAAITPNSTALKEANAPPNLPIGVLTAERI